MSFCNRSPVVYAQPVCTTSKAAIRMSMCLLAQCPSDSVAEQMAKFRILEILHVTE